MGAWREESSLEWCLARPVEIAGVRCLPIVRRQISCYQLAVGGGGLGDWTPVGLIWLGDPPRLLLFDPPDPQWLEVCDGLG